jgi:peptidyl-prolyl cis-trans isomerase D
MATLEKIRSKSVLLFIIIIAALLAFILGDFLTSGRTYFGTGTTVAKVAGHKIDYNQFKNRLDEQSNQLRQQNQDVDNDQLTQGVINQLLMEALLDDEYETLGINVTDAEISAAMTGKVPHQSAQQFIYSLSQSLGLPAASGAGVYDAMMNPAKYHLTADQAAQIKQMWTAQEQQVETALKQQKFGRLIAGLYTANVLDAKAIYNDNNTTSHITYVTKDFSSISDKDVTVSDSDIKSEWEKYKNRYRLQEPMRSIDYIRVAIEPSVTDVAAGQKEVEDALYGLRIGNGLDAVSGNTNFIVNRATTPRSAITDNNLKSFVDSASVGHAAIINQAGNAYTLAKVLNITQDIDSVNVSVIHTADAATLDSVMTKLAAGATVADFAQTENTQSQDSLWVSLINPQFDAKLKDLLTNANVGEFVPRTDTIQGQVINSIYRVNRRHNPVNAYELAVINYTIEPSITTINKLNSDLHKYLVANTNATNFAKNADAAGYSVLSGTVSASAPHIGNLNDSRSAVKWAMEAKRDEVSPVFGDSKQSYILAVAVKDIYDGDYVPYNSSLIKDMITAQVRADKKAQKLIDQYKGKAKDLKGYAKLLGDTIKVADVNFASPMFGNVGMNESDLQGQVAAAKKGALVGPVKGNSSVVVFVVNGRDTQGRPYNFEESAQRFNQTLGANSIFSNNNIFNVLVGKNKVHNYSLNFEQSRAN